ncbi:hypothetical protein [Mycobacterium sp. ACS4331]|uniref:hypothetical protein n=1 Tax=Mycobacterium sp. ACS4331 TaxID=1834121 RepID=UPI000801B77F|nr:hypothetical protein [Mycobacterium sp. ACS4331]OBF25547.1 hypothetical protein A5727_04225 [Mycobacterium sp. ACS4331]
MTSTSPQYARYIGRVGGLAVALGIGVAIAQGAGDAAAETEGPDGPSAASTDTAPKREARARTLADRVERSVTRASERIESRRAARSLRDVADRITASANSSARQADRPLPRTPRAPLRGVELLTNVGLARPTTEPASASTTAADPLATEEQLAAERRAAQIAKRPIVQLTRLVLKVAWYISAQRNFALVGGVDRENLAQLDRSLDEYVNQAAMEVQLLNPNKPRLLQQVMPPHTWGGQTVGGTRIWYDNPDTVYRFVAVNAASTYVIEGTYNPDAVPVDTNFSVLTGLNGETAVNRSWDEIEKDEVTGTFKIYVGSDPTRRDDPNYLYLTPEATLITTRNTLSDKAAEEAMGLTITRTSGPPDSLFAQIGGFLIPGIGPAITRNPTLVKLVSLIPPLPGPPLVLQAVETSLLMLILGITKQDEYIAVATRDPATGQLRQPNTLSEPAHNAQFLATQRQSTGYFQLADDEALVVTVTPNGAGYFNVPVTNVWTITDNDPGASLNSAHAVDPDGDGTYIVVISPTDPGVANWVSTGGLNQGTLSIRFQDVDPALGEPEISAQKMTHAELQALLAHQSA